MNIIHLLLLKVFKYNNKLNSLITLYLFYEYKYNNQKNN